MLVKVFPVVVCTVCRAVCDSSKVRHKLPDDGPDGPKHVGAIMRCFNCIF